MSCFLSCNERGEKNLIGFIAKYTVDANLFRLGSSIQKYVGSRGAASVWDKGGSGGRSPRQKKIKY